MTRKKTLKTKARDEHLEMLKLILEELRKMNSQLSSMGERPFQAAVSPTSPDNESDEELDSFE